MSRRKLTLAVAVSSNVLPAWQVAALRRVCALQFVDLQFVYIERPGSCDSEQYPLFYKANWLLRALLAFDKSLFRRRIKVDAFAPSDVSEVFEESGVPVVSAAERGRPGGLQEYLDKSEASLGTVDVILDCGCWLPKQLAEYTNMGIWRIVHHLGDAAEHAMPGVWECLNGEGVTGSRLEIVRPGADTAVLVTFAASSTTYGLSQSVNRNNPAWTSSTFFWRELQRLYHLGNDDFFAQAVSRNMPVQPSSAKSGQPFSWSSAAYSWVKYAVTVLTRVAREKTSWEQWILLYSLNEADKLEFQRYKKIIPPKDEFWADPQAVLLEDTYYVFMEVYQRKTKKGHISVIQIDKDGTVSDPQVVLEKDYHLSYPLIIEDKGRLYMLPETKGNRTIELYECVEFPTDWQRKAVLFDGIAATDATPFEHDGRWWMFVTVADCEASQCREETHLYFADELVSNSWTPHPRNPVLADVALARPAGKVFRENGRLIRPSQNCSHLYGYGLNFNEITVLTESDYEERPLQRFEPTWERGIIGLHTFTQAGPLRMIDALRYARR